MLTNVNDKTNGFIDTLKAKNQLFKNDEMILFLHPKMGRLKAKVLRTEYTAQMGSTCTILIYTNKDQNTLNVSVIDKKLMVINEKFLEKLVKRAV